MGRLVYCTSSNKWTLQTALICLCQDQMCVQYAAHQSFLLNRNPRRPFPTLIHLPKQTPAPCELRPRRGNSVGWIKNSLRVSMILLVFLQARRASKKKCINGDHRGMTYLFLRSFFHSFNTLHCQYWGKNSFFYMTTFLCNGTFVRQLDDFFF